MKRLILSISILSFTLSGCQEITHFSRDHAITGLGAVVGAGAGSLVGNKNNKKVWIIGGAVAGAFIGNQIGQYLNKQDQIKAEQANHQAIVTGKPQQWHNPQTHITGRAQIVNEQQVTQNVTIPVLKDRVKEVPPLDLISEKYKVVKTSKLLGGPSSEYKAVGRLNAGQQIDVIGKVQGKPWFMVANNHVGSGFVDAHSLTPIHTNSEISEQTATSVPSDQIIEKNIEANHTCRTVQQVIVLSDGTQKTEEITACNSPEGWKII
nr:glycine zipper domain-containing protein [uncultured Desulfobulbus sp.]